MLVRNLSIALALLGSLVSHNARADDHVIRPNCWDENVNGETQHHCEVNRPHRVAPPNHSPPAADPPPTPPVVVGPPAEALGWVYGPYTSCADQSCTTVFVNVVVDGINVRTEPNGPIILTLGNGTPLFVLQRQGDWVLVSAGCNLASTWTWSVTAYGLPLSVCY
jgi:hypothetical protein